MRDSAQLEQAVADGVAELGRLDVVVANAGITSFDAIADMSEEKWHTMIDVNLTGVWRTVKAALPHLADGGSIVFTSSTASLKAYANVGHYSAAKHGLTGLMRTLAVELGARRIRVNTIHPTQVDTPMLLNEATYRMFRPELEEPTIEDFQEASQTMMMLPTPYVHSEDLANAVLFLASDEARYITGTSLPVDAGAAARVIARCRGT